MSQIPTSGEGVSARPATSPREPDAHGQAALLLAEATLHALVEAGSLTLGQAIAVVETASEVKEEVAAATGESAGRMQQSLHLLSRIGRSLEIDADAAA